MYAFLVLLFILAVVYVATQTKKEGFSSTYDVPPSHKVNMPQDVLKPAPLPATVKGSTLPGTIPSAPYQQIAHTSPLPYQDPSLIKTTRTRILNVLEDLKGFLSFVAPQIDGTSDPAVQLPLMTAKGDLRTLEDTANVLQRNPGINSDITELQMDEIESNLAYLQRRAGLIGMKRPFVLEGFGTGLDEDGDDQDDETDGPLMEQGPATREQLVGFVTRIQGEIMRLSASGTNDPLVKARVSNLTQMKDQVEDIIKKLDSGAILTTEVPILKSDIAKALPVLGKPNEPLPQILQKFNLPAGLANMLPSNLQNDPTISRETGNLIQKYMSDLFEGTSAEVKVKLNYTSPRDVDLATARASSSDSTVDLSGFPSNEDLDRVSSVSTVDGGYMPPKMSDPFANGVRPTYLQTGGEPTHFDWKIRAKQIEDQIRRRGLRETDFGIMPKDAQVGNDFSWKGYTRMVCSRLQATSDPGLPVTCGCPPMDWKGWN